MYHGVLPSNACPHHSCLCNHFVSKLALSENVLIILISSCCCCFSYCCSWFMHSAKLPTPPQLQSHPSLQMDCHRYPSHRLCIIFMGLLISWGPLWPYVRWEWVGGLSQFFAAKSFAELSKIFPLWCSNFFFLAQNFSWIVTTVENWPQSALKISSFDFLMSCYKWPSLQCLMSCLGWGKNSVCCVNMNYNAHVRKWTPCYKNSL